MGSRVLHVTTVHSVYDTRIYEKQCLSLRQRGWSVHLIATDEARFTDRQPPHVMVRLVRVCKWRAARVLFSSVSLLPILFDRRFKIVHVHDPELLPLCVLLQATGRIVVFDMHEDIPRQILQKHWLPSWSRKTLSAAYRMIERLVLPWIPVVFAENSYPQSRPYVRRSVMVRNYPSIDRVRVYRETRHHDVFTAVYVGDVTAVRGVETMCEAVVALRAEGLAIDLEIIGRCSDDVARRLAERHSGSNSSIRFLGRLPYEEAMRRASKAHVGLSLLWPLPNYADSLPTKILEYFLLGLPVVASTGTLGGRLVAEARGGRVVDARSSHQLQCALRELAKDAPAREAMAQAGMHYTRERFDWEQEADRLDAFYRELLGLGESDQKTR